MTMISVYATITLCALSAVLGCLVAMILGRIRRLSSNAVQTKIQPAIDQAAALKERELRLMVESLYNLTTQVDSHVGEHSLRVSEITNTLDVPDEVGSTMVLAAGKLLITANQKLQADLEEAKSEIERQREQTNACMLESRTDALTNLANRRAFDLEISRAFAQRRRDGTPFSLLIIDVDHFKRINDKYGHMVGDRLLKGFSRCLLNTFRDTDFVARYGGEEFVAILPKTPLHEAIKTAERVRMAVAECRFRVGELEMQITASLGVKEVGDHETQVQLMEKADSAMYAAKRGGRNRCYFHDGTTFQLVEAVAIPESAPSTSSAGAAAAVVIDSESDSTVVRASLAMIPIPQGSIELQAQF